MKIPTTCLLFTLFSIHLSLADSDSPNGSLLDFESLNLGHHSSRESDGNEFNSEILAPFAMALSQELDDGSGKIDLGSQDTSIDSELLISVSKDPTVINGLESFGPHGPNFFSDKVTKSSIDVVSASHEPQVKPSTAFDWSLSTEALTSSATITSSIETSSHSNEITSDYVTKTPTTLETITSTLQNSPIEASTIPQFSATATEDVTQSTKTTSSDVQSSNAGTSTTESLISTKSPEPILRPEVPKPFQHSSEEPINVPHSVTSSESLLAQDQANIEKTIKSSIEKVLKEKLENNDYFGRNSKQAEEVKPIPSSSSAKVTSISDETSLSISSETLKTTELPVVTKTVVVSEPTSSVAMTSTTPSPIPQTKDGEMGSTKPSFPTSDSDIEKFIKDNLDKDLPDLNVEKLKSILDILLKLQGADGNTESTTSKQVESVVEGETPLDSKAKEIDTNLGESHKSTLQDFESLEPEILESLGLKETVEESRDTEHGSFLRKLKNIPQNVIDLVDERYGDEFREEHSENSKGKKHSEGPSAAVPKKKKQKNTEAKTHNKALESGIEKNSSLNKVVKEKAKASPSLKEKSNDTPKKESNPQSKKSAKKPIPKKNLDLPVKEEPEDDYKELNKGKITFGFDKTKKKIGLKKPKAESKTGIEPELEDLEYYEPEKFLFGKASIDDEELIEEEPSADDNDVDDEIAKSKEELARLTKKKSNSTGSDGNEKSRNGTVPILDKVLGLLKDNDNSDKASTRRNNSHSDPYAIPKVPLDQCLNFQKNRSQQSRHQLKAPWRGNQIRTTHWKNIKRIHRCCLQKSVIQIRRLILQGLRQIPFGWYRGQ